MPANIADPLVQFQPDNPFVIIWRYMNLRKFEELVESNKLIFTSVDKFSDQYEGHNTTVGNLIANVELGSAAGVDLYNKAFKTIRESSYVNCWTLGPAENAAFWEIYGKGDTAVAIRSMYSKLRNVLPDEYVIGRVKYIDYNSSPGFVVDDDSAFPYFSHVYHKRLEYSYEKEIRAARIPRVGRPDEQTSADVHIPILSDLIDTVCIRRSDSDKEKKRVKSLCNKHKLNYRESRINDQPLQIRMSEQQRAIFTDKIAAAKVPEDLPEILYAILISRLFLETLRGE